MTIIHTQLSLLITLLFLLVMAAVGFTRHAPKALSRSLWGPVAHVNPHRTLRMASTTPAPAPTPEPTTNESNPGGRKASASSGNKAFTGVKFDLQPPKGTRDFYPEDHRLKNWLFGKWRNVAHRFGFEEYDAPVLENEELYIRKAGDEVTSQLYNFEDKGGRRLSLRPEMTPSLARMVLARQNALSFPIKWFSIPQCWRYERMTRGRRREHYQWNMDIWGSEGIETEAELLAAVVASFKDMGITAQDVGIKVNSRKLINDILLQLGVPEDRWSAACVLIDKLDKIPAEDMDKELQKLGLSVPSVQKLLQYINTTDISTLSELLGPNASGIVEINQLMALTEAYGYREWIQFDASVIRGLSYYTGIVFEGFDRSKQLRAICGGGRYDSLLESLGGAAIPAVGFGFGDAVIVELLKMKDLLPDVSSSGSVDALVYAMTPELYAEAVRLATELRSSGARVELIFPNKKTKWAFQRADKLGAGYLVMMAPDEFKENKFVVKNLRDKTQATYELGSEDVQRVAEMVAAGAKATSGEVNL